MKIRSLIFSTLLGAAMAAPAIVWSKHGKSDKSVVYSSKSVKASTMIGNTIKDTPKDMALTAAIFVVGRSDDGTETLSKMTSDGSLPNVSSKYDDATIVHSHVAGIASPYSLASDAQSKTKKPVLEISLSEFSSKLTSLGQEPKPLDIEVDEYGMVNKDQKIAIKRHNALNDADIVIVHVPTHVNPKIVDEAIVKTIDHKLVGNVVLAGIRSTAEVKRERNLEARRRMKIMTEAGIGASRKGRRLDEDNGDDNTSSDNSDMAGVYYVFMTPNIFAGLLFGLLFIVVTYIGINCMGMISGQDVYVSKMPTIGREA